MCVSLVMEYILTDMIRLGKTFFQVAEFEGDELVDVASVGIFVNLGLRFSQSFSTDITEGRGS